MDCSSQPAICMSSLFLVHLGFMFICFHFLWSSFYSRTETFANLLKVRANDFLESFNSVLYCSSFYHLFNNATNTNICTSKYTNSLTLVVWTPSSMCWAHTTNLGEYVYLCGQMVVLNHIFRFIKFSLLEPLQHEQNSMRIEKLLIVAGENSY